MTSHAPSSSLPVEPGTTRNAADGRPILSREGRWIEMASRNDLVAAILEEAPV